MANNPDKHQSDADRAHDESITADFADARNAQLAAETVRLEGFTVEVPAATRLVVRTGADARSAEKATDLLRAYGATDVRGASDTADAEAHRFVTPPAAAGRQAVSGSASGASLPPGMQEAARIELQEEELHPETRSVVTGEVRIRREVVTETRTIKVPITREEIVIERRSITPQPADQAEATTSDPVIQSLMDRLRQLQPGESLRVPIIEEEVVVSKRPVVVEEITVRKRLQEETKHFSDTIRREVAHVETTGSAHVPEAQSSQPGGVA